MEDQRTIEIGLKGLLSSLALVLGLVGALVGYGIAWGHMEAKTTSLEARIVKIEADSAATRSELQEARRTLSEISGALKPSRIVD